MQRHSRFGHNMHVEFAATTVSTSLLFKGPNRQMTPTLLTVYPKPFGMAGALSRAISEDSVGACNEICCYFGHPVEAKCRARLVERRMRFN